ncbi:MAG TPA: class I SAM-dependent methyltransferase [Anaerolineales bacterium]|nr:class I SAM-dependent methyltransferase [Anaerolineales bacterium]
MNACDNLEEFTDPPNYDIEEGERSAPRVAFYCELAKTIGGPVLEIACGSGLVTIPVAAQGLDVTGLDLAHSMLVHARKKAEQQNLYIRWVEADARSFHLGTQYQFVYLTGNAFQAFLRCENQEALLASVKRHLAPKGVFAFETRNPSGHDLTDQPEEEFDQSYTSVEGHQVSVFFTQRYDPLAQIMYWTSYRRWNNGEGDHNKETHIACRFTHPQELEALLHYNGFQIIQQYGNWDKEPLSASSPSIISICKVR